MGDHFSTNPLAQGCRLTLSLVIPRPAPRPLCPMSPGHGPYFANPKFHPSAACVGGACVICVDLLICKIPGKQDFRIQESNAFLACSLSLSFGVMVCSHGPILVSSI